ncbi:MAG: Ni/Fe hydrogenase subunit alpha [Thermoanaerobaculales bacterium]|nr:Ni/Fe hydrogenase subunit alpha [Thermoanaerobaculales bacterium]
MTTGRTITIPHLGRVEGHGGIYVKIAGDQVLDVNMDIHEGSRYYEALLKGKHFLEVQGIITRVCAICSSSHTVAALTALEGALGVKVSRRVYCLRGLLFLGGIIESHALHVFALALPDFLGFDSVIAMAAKYPDQVKFALKLKQLGNTLQTLVGGRAVHPINTLVGGFGKIPQHGDLQKARADLLAALDPLMDFVDLVTTIEVPTWAAQPTIYVALRPYEEAFRFRGVSICTSQGNEYDIESYRETVQEFTVEHSHAKHSALASGETYMVGSLARLHLWGHYLQGRAKEAFNKLFPDGPKDNILLNNWAQLVELVHCLERGVELCDLLLGMDEKRSEMVEYEIGAGRGISAIEVPRGTLYHEYELDQEGRVVTANVITPTTQNLANTERDLRKAVEGMLEEGESLTDDEIKLQLEMVARAYDPCISCSVHVIREES